MTPKTQTRLPGRRERELRLAGLATRQAGAVAKRQLLSLGFGEEAIKVRLDRGQLAAIHRNVYSVGHVRADRRARWWAAVLAYGPDALLSHRSAAARWGLARAERTVTEVTASTGRQGFSRRQRIWIHRGRLDGEDRTERNDIPVTSVARTLFDLAEVVDFGRLEGAWEEADRLHLLRLPAVEQVCARGYGRRALKPIRRLLTEARAAATVRSPLEERFQHFCRFYDLPPHHTNITVLGYEVDVLWPAAHLVVELDSWEFHRHRAAFQRDRARDTRLLVAGYRTIRITHDRLDTEASTLATEIKQLLSQAAQLQPSPDQPLPFKP
jgi:very-short-patch-repair endonuclease